MVKPTLWPALRFGFRIALAVIFTSLILARASESESKTFLLLKDPDSSVITQFTSDLVVDDDGGLTATESITVDVPEGKHGIFRFWDLSDKIDRTVRYIPQDIRVSKDGAPVPVRLSWRNGKEFRVAKIGDSAQTLSPGEHTYVISYRIPGTISPEGQGSRFEWRPIASGWSMPIRQANITIDLPHEPRSPLCRADFARKCDEFEVQDNTLSIQVNNLAAHREVRVAATFAQEAPAQVTLPWPIRFDTVFGRSLWSLALVVVLSLAALIAAYALELRTREKKPSFPLAYEPPEGLGPVLTRYVSRETVGRHAFTATMLHLAERGVITLERQEAKKWTIVGNWSWPEWETLDEVSQSFGESLRIRERQALFKMDGSASSGERLADAKTQMSTAAREWGESNGFVVKDKREFTFRIAIGIVAAAAVVFAFFLPTPTVWALPFVTALIGGVGLFERGVGTRRSPAGLELWSKAGGFERFLTTRSAEERFVFADHKDLYAAYIPYAIAFNAARSWTKRYQTTVAEIHETPHWLPADSDISSVRAISRSISSFDSSLASALTAYRATQLTSSIGSDRDRDRSGSGGGSRGGGGGGFSGGGGGGGGGGSW